MDAKEYDRIADLLMQIRKKYAVLEIKEHHDRHHRDVFVKQLDYLLKLNDKFAYWESKGWI